MIVYRLLHCFILPALALRAFWLWLRGAMSGADLRESLWGPRITGPAIWVHGASLGEVRSARPVITALSRVHPVIVTATRKPAKDAVNGWGLTAVIGAMAPLASGLITARMLRKNQIKMLIVLENELWPARITAALNADIPVVLLSARMSAGSARTWGRLPRVIGPILDRVALVVPQDGGSAQRLIALGARAQRMAPVVKLKAAYRAEPHPRPAGFVAWQRRETILAAATHQGEDQIILSAFAIAQKSNPALRLIIAPRHANRSDEVAVLVTAMGHPDLRRSRGDMPDGAIYLADTMGEMALWYDLAGVAFIGGSLVPKGGHTPYEPAAHRCVLLHGPHVANFTEDYASFAAADAAVEVLGDTELAAAILAHLDY